MQKPTKTKKELQEMIHDAVAADGESGAAVRIRGNRSGDWAVEILDGGADVKEDIAEAVVQLRALYDLA
jgi:hypothetical protein